MTRHVNIVVSHHLAPEDWAILEAYCARAKRLTETKLLAADQSAIHGKMRYTRENGLWFEAQLAFRFFYLKKERTFFPRTLGIIGKYTADPDARQALKVLSNRWHDHLFAKALTITLNDRPMNSGLLLDLWFNAHYFHSEEEKVSALAQLNAAFSRRAMEGRRPRRGARDSRPLDGRRRVIERRHARAIATWCA